MEHRVPIHLEYRTPTRNILTRNAPLLLPIIAFSVPLKLQTLIKRPLLLDHSLDGPSAVIITGPRPAAAHLPRVGRKAGLADERLEGLRVVVGAEETSYQDTGQL